MTPSSRGRPPQVLRLLFCIHTCLIQTRDSLVALSQYPRILYRVLCLHFWRLSNTTNSTPAARVPLLHNMPGILPMKVIKVGGTGTTSRIAQACDRCRSKKIRCDGVRPCCSQCANVGFECRTSDKLSRRAFPRGYTESLEERVRSLETEVKDLKDLLDEKDEKIDVLSRIHSFTPPHRAASARSPSASATVKSSTSASSDGVFHVERSTTRPSQRSQNPFIGFSSTQGFAGMLYLSHCK